MTKKQLGQTLDALTLIISILESLVKDLMVSYDLAEPVKRVGVEPATDQPEDKLRLLVIKRKNGID